MTTATHSRKAYLETPLKWEVQPRVLFINDPKLTALEHMKAFLGNRKNANLVANDDSALTLIRTQPFGYDMIVLNIAPAKEGAQHDDSHHHDSTYFLQEIGKLGNLAGIPVVVVSDELHDIKRPKTTVCPRNVTVDQLYAAASALLEDRAAAKNQQRVM